MKRQLIRSLGIALIFVAFSLPTKTGCQLTPGGLATSLAAQTTLDCATNCRLQLVFDKSLCRGLKGQSRTECFTSADAAYRICIAQCSRHR